MRMVVRSDGGEPARPNAPIYVGDGSFRGMAEGPAEGPATADRWVPPLRPETLLLLAGLALFLVFLALEPFLSYAVFGSDSGEYYRLTADLVATGQIPHGAAYAGWGSAYPDFPGIYLLAGAGAGALGTSPFSALTILVPTVAVLSVFPLFLLFRRLYPHDTVALFGAAVASVAMPRMFSIAHPAPLALGDFLCVAALWMLVESRREVRWFVPLALTTGALVVTHHLSTYFFVVSALGGLLLLELWRPGLWSRRFPLRELGFLAGTISVTFVFWFYGTTTFVAKVLLPGFGGSTFVGFGGFEAIGLGGVVAAGLLIRLRRSRVGRPRRWVRLPSDRSVLRDAVLLTVGIFGAISVLLVVPIPGTTQSTSALAIAWFAPVLALGILCSGSRKALTPARLGPFALPWLGALGLSAGGGLLLSAIGSADPRYAVLAGFASALSPARHVEYLFLPLGLLVAVGAGRLVARAGDVGGRRALAAATLAVVVVLAANAAIVYPPQSDFGGFEEGLTHGDAAIWMWIGIAEPRTATVASDHRLSSMIFGFDGNPGTWVTTPILFNGDAAQWPQAYAELNASGVPNPADARPIDLVVVDSVMYSGVALSPSALAVPLSPAAIAWFAGAPFLPIYENGADVVYAVVP
jgi:hypothetical protein